MTDIEAKTACRTPSEGCDGVTNIPTWKYDLLSHTITKAVMEAGPDGLPFSKLKDDVRSRLPDTQLERLGSLGWHVTTVKLEMEVRGDLVRLKTVPQRLTVPGIGT